MSDASWAVQQAIFAALNNALSVDIYDDVPQGAALPYVVVGDGTAVDDSDKANDGQEHSALVTVFSDYNGRREVKELLGEVYGALHRADLSIAGHVLVSCRFDGATSVGRAADGQSYQGSHRYELITQSA